MLADHPHPRMQAILYRGRYNDLHRLPGHVRPISVILAYHHFTQRTPRWLLPDYVRPNSETPTGIFFDKFLFSVAGQYQVVDSRGESFGTSTAC